MIVIGRKLRVAALVGVVLLSLYALLGFFAVPRILVSQAKAFAARNWQRELALGAVSFNPFTLELRIDDLALPDADGKPLLGFRHLRVDLNLASLLGRASIEEIELEAPYTHARIAADRSVNLAELARPFAAGEPAAATDDPLSVFIGHFAVRDGRVELEDHTPSAPFAIRLTPISFDLENFSTRDTGGNTFALQARSAADEKFDLAGSFALRPLTVRGTFGVTGLELSTPRAYLADALPFELSSGVVTLNGGYDIAVEPRLEIVATLEKFLATELGVREKGPGADDVHLARLDVADTKLDLAKRALSIGRIAVSGGRVLARLDAGGRLNLAMLGGARDGAAPAAPAADSPGWTVAAPDIAVADLAVKFADRQFEPGASFDLAPLNLRVSNYRNAPDADVDLHLDLEIDSRGKLVVDGKSRPAAATFDGKVSLTGFDLASLQPYVGRNTQMTLLSGRLSSQLDVRRDADGVLDLRGNGEVAALRTIDAALRADFVKWDLLRATGIDFRAASGARPGRLAIQTLFAQAPYARVIIAPDQTINVSKVLSPGAAASRGAEKAPAAASRAVGPAEQPLQMSIGTVRIANGSANFADFWIQPNYAVSLASLGGTITGLDSKPGSRAKVQIDGKVDKYAPAKIAGEINILSQSAYTDLTVSLKGVELSTVTPYSGRFAGYQIEKGKLNVDVNYLVENRTLKAGQHFVLDQLELGARVDSPDAVHLPLKIAVALMKDRNGVIDIDLPLTGSLDDPQFRVGPLIWKAFLGLLTKVATAPFAWLGSLGGGDAEMNVIEFAPGEATLEAAGNERLGAVARALADRPALSLDVPMTWSVETDGPALAKKALDARLRLAAEKGGGASDDPARRFDLLLSAFRAEMTRETALPAAAATVSAAKRRDVDTEAFVAASAGLEAALLASRPVSEREFEELGAARGRAIQDVLLGGGSLDPARVFLVRAQDAKTEGGKVRAELALK